MNSRNFFRHGVALSVLSLSMGVLTTRTLAQKSPNTPFSTDALKTEITYLSSDALTGRGSGTDGNLKAATFVANEFRRYGLKPLGTYKQTDTDAPLEGLGYFQPFSYSAGRMVGSASKLTAIATDKTVAEYAANKDFAISPLSGAGNAEEVEVVFAGYGVSAPSAGRDDYAGVDVTGKVVILLPGTVKGFEKFSQLRAQALVARDRGAVAVITSGTEGATATPGAKLSFENQSDSGIPVFLLQPDALARLIASSGKSYDALKADTDAGKPTTDILPVKLSFNADVQKIRKVTQNVVGYVEGTDYNLKDEFVIIGAHLDHLGMGGVGSLDPSGQPAVHHGADDNASGTAGVLELAHYFAAHRPKRSLLFIGFSGEELGLLGSAYYAKEPVVTLNNTVAMLNLDMIGRLNPTSETLIVGGSGTAQEFPAMLDDLTQQENLAGRGLKLSRSDTGFGASDHQSFYVQNIPVLFFFTGVHADYHRPSDTVDKINLTGEAQVLELVRASVVKIANAPTRPTFVKVQAPAPAANNGDTGGNRSFKVYLGTIPNYSAEGVQGVLLDGVREGSPAATAGLKAGDIITRMNNLVISGLQDYVTALQQLNPGEAVAITVRRGAETLTLNATVTERK